MKKNVKLVLTASILSLGVAFTSLAFGGCGTTNDNEKDPDQNIVTPNPDPNPDVDPTPDPNPGVDPDPAPPTPPVEDDSKYETTRIPKTDLNAVFKKVRDGKNYTFSLISVDNDFGGTLKRDGNKMYYTNIQSGENYFVTNDGENDLKISYNTSSDKWIASISDSSDDTVLTVASADIKIPLILNSISYKTYNTKTGEFKGKWENDKGDLINVSVFVNKEGETVISVEVKVHDEKAPYSFIFEELGTTSVTLPTYTLNGSEIDNSKNVLTVENGVYNFDYKLVKPILEKWLKGENARKTDLVDELNSLKNCETEQVLFMNLSKDNFELFVVYKDLDLNQRYLGQLNVSDRALYQKLSSVNSLTENELTDYLKNSNGAVVGSSNAKNYSIDYITSDADFASHKDQFNALTDKIIERAQTVGTQGNSIDNLGKIVDYSDYDIITGFKTKADGPTTATYKCEGENYNFNLVYLIENNGNYQLVDFLVVSSTQKGFDKLLTNITGQDATTAKNWMVVSAESTDMTAGNGALYDYSAKTTYSVNYNARDVIVDDKYSLV